MAEQHYVDHSGLEIIPGFYLDRQSDTLIQITGFIGDVPQIELSDNTGVFSAKPNYTINLLRLNFPQKYLDRKQKELDWMRKKLQGLEKVTQSTQTSEREKVLDKIATDELLDGQ